MYYYYYYYYLSSTKEAIFLSFLVLLRNLFPRESTIPYDFKVSSDWQAFLVQITCAEGFDNIKV